MTEPSAAFPALVAIDGPGNQHISGVASGMLLSREAVEQILRTCAPESAAAHQTEVYEIRMDASSTQSLLPPLVEATKAANDGYFRFTLHGFRDHDPPVVVVLGSDRPTTVDLHAEKSTRKLTEVIALSDGARVRFPHRAEDQPVEIGGLMMFPSFVPYQLSAGAWLIARVLGPSFR